MRYVRRYGDAPPKKEQVEPMPRFECTNCHALVTYADIDRPYFERHLWECNMCWSVIAKQRYPVNIPGGVTLFSAMSSALGDDIVARLVRAQYAKDNPDETIMHLGLCDAADAIAEHKPDKFFWANITNFIDRPREGVIHFYVENEGREYEARGIYPWLWFEPREVGGLPAKYMVLHVRNINKAPFKNAEPMIVFKVTMLLERWIMAGKIDGVVLVGNDLPIELEDLPPQFVDLRNKLTIEEIAWVCNHSRGFIGKDSGVAHLAAASGAKVLAWGFRDMRWKPKAPPGMVTAMTAEESNGQSVYMKAQEVFA